MTNEELVMAYQNGDKSAMAAIIEKNRGLVNTFVNQCQGLEASYLDRYDLEQNGCMGLMDAVKRFDPLLGFKFSTYASMSIKRNLYRSIRVSTPWEKRSSSESKLCNVISAFDFLPGTENVTYMDTFEDESAQTAYHEAIEVIDREILRKDLFLVLNKGLGANNLARNLIILNYGLTGKAYSVNELATKYQLSLNRINHLIPAGLKKIKRSEAGKQLKEKYKIEFFHNSLENLTALQYKNPVYCAIELEYLKAIS
ncbi:sigma-70 family RNA polymerase sigma factor [Acetobacterium bakii]|uniref:RNA polymerase sigma-70 region 2 domain-containing protein n=1 Tax=Acetobacterium bakii TaxID=52689 RepID=A0A0L6TYZ6_9FIRM|nr:sigma-70 family RNA polymerase sigma factor [Acetobacterium bakii]KNZ41468.1 hypothetical protein AKG39_11935 [Acetobacterium bakii]